MLCHCDSRFCCPSQAYYCAHVSFTAGIELLLPGKAFSLYGSAIEICQDTKNRCKHALSVCRFGIYGAKVLYRLEGNRHN